MSQRRQMPMAARLVPVLIGLGACALFMIQSCTTGPFGRAQLRAINEQQESQLGEQAFMEVKQQEQRNIIPQNQNIVLAVREIAAKLETAALDPEVLQAFQLSANNFTWEVEVVDSEEANAFCLPGGKIVVYTGIVPIAQTDAALAAVMGHEISHALAHHGAERMAHEELKKRGLTSVASGLGDMDPQQRQLVMTALGVSAQYLGQLPFSREHESEADRMGLILLAKSGFDPTEAIRFWERMQQVGGGRTQPQFMSTHPSHETRINDLTAWQSEANQFYQKSQKIKTELLPAVYNAERPR